MSAHKAEDPRNSFPPFAPLPIFPNQILSFHFSSLLKFHSFFFFLTVKRICSLGLSSTLLCLLRQLPDPDLRLPLRRWITPQSIRRRSSGVSATASLQWKSGKTGWNRFLVFWDHIF